MNIVVLTTRLFDVPRSGGEIGTARLLAALLDAGHEVQVIGRGPLPRSGFLALRYRSLGLLLPSFSEMPVLRQLSSLLAAWLGGQASTVYRHGGAGAARQLRRLLADGTVAPPDVLVVDHLQAWPWLRHVGSHLAAPLLVMHNVESDCYAERACNPQLAGWRHWLARQVLQRESRLLLALEGQALRGAAAVACVSDSDASRLQALAAAWGASARVHALAVFALRRDLRPLPVPRKAPRTARGSVPCSAPGSAPVAEPRRIGMIGTWNWAPNRVGLDWMLQRVLPLLPPHCVLVLAGAGLDGMALPPGVVNLGRVDDSITFYVNVDLVAVAARAGSGVQEKTVDAIAFAPAVVATPLALRGLGAQLPSHVHVADEAESFAQLCASCALDAHATDGAHDWAQQRRKAYRETLDRCLHAASGRLSAVAPETAAAAPAFPACQAHANAAAARNRS